MRYNKLVRDRIPGIIRKNGGNPRIHRAVCIEFGSALKDKLWEEAEEFWQSEKPEEIADILEVIDALMKYHGFSKLKITKLKKDKARIKGKFKNRIILEEA